MENKILELINNSNSIVILTHESPDGDAIGSSMAMYHYLLSINKNVDVVIQNIPKIYFMLEDINKVVDTTDKLYDLGIVMDCSSKIRVGQVSNVLDNCRHTIVIDHHSTNTKYGDINYIEGNCPACCQMVYYLFKYWNVNINKTIGEDLITGIITDTNGFRNDNVNEFTFLLAAELKKLGVDIHYFMNKVFFEKTIPQFELMKIVNDRLEFFMDGRVAFSYITVDDIKNTNAVAGDHEGLVDIGKSIVGVDISIFIREENGYKVSIRTSNKVDASKIANIFGGGGHIRAAGCTINLNFKETKQILLNEIKKVINE